MKTYLISAFLLSVLATFLFENSQQYELYKTSAIKHPILSAIKLQAKPVLINPVPLEEAEVYEVEPIVFWAESKRIKTNLDTVVIATNGYHPCGCQPNYPPIRIKEQIEEIEIEESLFAEPLYVDPYIFQTKLYPNPSQFQSTLEIDIESEEQFEIEMYDLNGRKVRDIHSGELFAGVNRFVLDIQDLNSGMYLISVRSDHQQETLKLQKLN